jgi:hypothetical protein
VAARDEAVSDGWFGPVMPALAVRIGDVVAAPAGPWAVVASKAEPRESALIGMHGSLTPAEQLVPLLTWPRPDSEGTGPHYRAPDGGGHGRR